MVKILFFIVSIGAYLFSSSIGMIEKGDLDKFEDAFALVTRGNETVTASTTGFKIFENDTIKTFRKSALQIRLKDGTSIKIGPKTTLNVEKYIFDLTNKVNNATNIKIDNGTFQIKTGSIGNDSPNNFKIKTKFSTMELIRANVSEAEIFGNQGKVSITGGSMDVTSGGSTITVNTGEMISYGENTALSKALKVEIGDMLNVTKDLKAPSSDIAMIKIKTVPINPNVAKQIRLELIRKGIDREYINLLNVDTGTEISIDPIPLDSIKNIYNSQHKLASDFFNKTSNEGKVLTFNLKEVDLQKYHKVIFQNFNQN